MYTATRGDYEIGRASLFNLVDEVVNGLAKFYPGDEVVVKDDSDRQVCRIVFEVGGCVQVVPEVADFNQL